MDKRGREYHHFPSKLFCRTVPKLSYGNPLAFHYFRISQTIRGKRGGGGGELRSSVENVSSQCRKITERPFCLSECFGY